MARKFKDRLHVQVQIKLDQHNIIPVQTSHDWQLVVIKYRNMVFPSAYTITKIDRLCWDIWMSQTTFINSVHTVPYKHIW